MVTHRSVCRLTRFFPLHTIIIRHRIIMESSTLVRNVDACCVHYHIPTGHKPPWFVSVKFASIFRVSLQSSNFLSDHLRVLLLMQVHGVLSFHIILPTWTHPFYFCLPSSQPFSVPTSRTSGDNSYAAGPTTGLIWTRTECC